MQIQSISKRNRANHPTFTYALIAIFIFLTYTLWHAALRQCPPPPACPSTTVDSTPQPSTPNIAAYVGVMTGFVDDRYTQDANNYIHRRTALRNTWFPKDKAGHQQLADQGIVMRFVLGKGDSPKQERQVVTEIQQYDDYLRLPIPESYGGLPFKVLTFLKTIVQQYNMTYIFKVDDDIYLRTDRVVPVVRQYVREGIDYSGCQKQGEVFNDPRIKWYEPQFSLLGSQYFTHVWGSSYVVSGRAAQALASLPPGMLRFFNNEDVTVGSWMLAFNLTHKDDRRFCETSCSETSITVWNYPDCAGLCEPVRQVAELHVDPACHSPPTQGDTGEVKEEWHHFDFAPVPVLD